jgi:cytochrome c-type biogenesis protein CcmH/NrfF
VIGGMALLLALRRGNKMAANPLSTEEKQRLQRLLEGSDVKKM